MKKLFLAFFIIISILLFVNPLRQLVYSDELDDLNKEIAQLQEAFEASKNATKPLESQLNNLKSQLQSIDNQITAINADLEKKRKDIEKGYIELADQKDLFDKAVRNSYIKSYTISPLNTLLSSTNPADLIKALVYQKRDTEQDKNEITRIALNLLDLEQRREKLEDEEARLAIAQSAIDSNRAEIEEVVVGAKAYQTELSGQIAELVKQQQQILAQRLGILNLPTSLGAGNLTCVDDRDSKYNPGFSPAFAFFTAGIPHRVGLNQYGALGRAQAGQSYDDILRAYYNFDGYQDFAGITINVNNGNGVNQGSIIWSGSLEDYAKRIYEVPESWPIEALKAQVIAVRSYALSVTNNGADSICANQNCQVFKTDPKTKAWDQAVNDTSGKVMMSGGQPITAWYASTAGGYTYTSGEVWSSNKPWTKNLKDTPTNIESFSDLENNSYDKDSPCNYAAQGFRDQYNKSAWLKSEEIADIANVILLSRACPDCGDKLYQTDKSHPYGREVWDESQVRQELSSRGITPFTSVSNVSISADFGSGRTTTVSISGNRSESFSGEEFKHAFNLRAPANIQIVGPLYNIETK